jgi:hypothetical protein
MVIGLVQSGNGTVSATIAIGELKLILDWAHTTWQVLQMNASKKTLQHQQQVYPLLMIYDLLLLIGKRKRSDSCS